MTMRVLLVGMNSFDSGKTQFAVKLSRTLTENGYSIEYFKPLSGHNYWYKYDHTQLCLRKGIIVSADAIEVRSAFESKQPIELANPVHSLFVPMKLERPLQNLPNTLGLAGANSILTMERFSRPDNSDIDTTVLVAQQLLEDEQLIISQEEAGMLTKGAAILSISNLEEVQEFERLNFERYVSDAFTKLERSVDIVIIEGFNNAAWPWDGLGSVDSVILISPGNIFSYDPERFKKAAYLMNRGNLPIREVTFGRISDLLKPTSHLEIRPDTNISVNEIEKLGISFHTGKKD
ncbi:MAG: hypothetical protein AM325_009980 [Candidatus Thorarchaeota archaeon SMTZ1-45]|nr:MAG: hypothetical protein AM325_11565 [Candidatus Thorarchaeota archaeon SMTZ1-45]